MKTLNTPRVKFTVTDEILETAIRGDSSHCMIADAIKVAVPTAHNISVDIQTIRFSDKDKGVRYIFLTPRIAQVAILAFDEGEHPKPFSVMLRGGQAVPMRRVKANIERSPAQRKALENAQAKGLEALQALREGPKKPPQNSTGPTFLAASDKDVSRPTITGGKPAPVTTVGRRRVFGLKAIGRNPGAR